MVRFSTNFETAPLLKKHSSADAAPQATWRRRIGPTSDFRCFWLLLVAFGCFWLLLVAFRWLSLASVGLRWPSVASCCTLALLPVPSCCFFQLRCFRSPPARGGQVQLVLSVEHGRCYSVLSYSGFHCGVLRCLFSCSSLRS